MRRSACSGLLFAMLAVAGCDGRSNTLGVTAKVETPDGPYADIAQSLDNRVNDGTVSGYSFVLVDAEGERFERSVGVDSQGRNFSSHSPVQIASSSKALAAAAVMTLVDRRMLDLDVPIHRYLSGSPVAWPTSATLDQKADITLRMLLAHTSGLPGLNDAPACVSNPDYEGGLEACVAVIAGNATPLRAAPGSVFIYGGTGYQVAGYVAQIVSGAASWQDFFRDSIAEPLNASSEMFYEEGGNPRIGGGALSSASAYGRFLRMMLRNGFAGDDAELHRLLSNRSVIELRRNQLQPPAASEAIDTYSAPNSYTPYALAGRSYPYYGLGFFLEAPALYQNADYYSPGPEVSDQGLFGATPWIDFGLDYAAMILIDEVAAAAPPPPDNPQSQSPATGLQKGIALWNEVRPLTIRHYSTPD